MKHRQFRASLRQSHAWWLARTSLFAGKFSGQLLGPAESNWMVAASLSASLQREDGVAVSPLGGMILDGGHPIQTSSMAERLLVYPQGGNWRVVVMSGTLSLPAWVAPSKLELAITIG